MIKRLLFNINGKMLTHQFRGQNESKVLFYIQARTVEEPSN